jgi:hypothetical protein
MLHGHCSDNRHICYLKVAEKLHILGLSVATHGFHAGVDAAEALVGEHLLALLVVSVTVEDHLRVGFGGFEISLCMAK